MKSLSIFSFLFVVLPLHAFAGGREYLVGGWQPIKDITDPEVQKAGEFAVSEYNKESKGSLKFVSVVKGARQVVAGTKFKLLVAAEDGGATKNYEAVVWVKPWQKFEKLLSFQTNQGLIMMRVK